jgi:predicted MarR family transcription regulator
LIDSDQILGSQEDVERFVKSACEKYAEITSELLQQAKPVSDSPKALKIDEIRELLEDISGLEGDLEGVARE